MTGVYLFPKDFVRGFEFQAFSGAMIEAVHGRFHVLGCDVFEAHFLGEELANEAVHVLIGTALPRGIGMSEEVLRIEARSDMLML